MALHERLNQFEKRIAALEAVVKDMAHTQAEMVESIEDEDKPTPLITLDGDEVGHERDQDTPL